MRSKWCIKALTDCEDTSSRRASKTMKHDGFHTVQLGERGENKEKHDELNVKAVTEMLQRHAEFYVRGDIMFCTKQNNTSSKVDSPSETTHYILICYKDLKDVMGLSRQRGHLD